MTVTVVRYQTKPERADENQALVEAVYAELAETRPAGFHYSTYRLADGVSFVHVGTIDGETNPLPSTAAFQAFVADIGDRCVEPPAASEASRIGRYESH